MSLILICSGGRDWWSPHKLQGLRRAVDRAPAGPTKAGLEQIAQEAEVTCRAREAFTEMHLSRVIALAREIDPIGPWKMIHGDAIGADTLCHVIIQELAPDWSIQPMPADWKTYGKAAGMIRNRGMRDLAIAEVGRENVALFSLPGGRGTMGMRRLALEANIRVFIAEPTTEEIRLCPQLSPSY